MLLRYCSYSYLKNRLFTWETLTVLLAFCGIFHLVLKVFNAIFPPIPAPPCVVFSIYLSLCIVCALYRRRPIMHEVHSIYGKDTNIEICIGDIFSKRGCRVIPTNTSFDTKLDDIIISEKSVQGQFQKQLKWKDDELSKFIAEKLHGIAAEEERFSKVGGNTKIYPMGTAVFIDEKVASYILLAMASLNENGVAFCSRKEIEASLDKLWDFANEKMTFADEINIPIIGIKHARLNITIDEMILIISLSFIKAALSKKITKKLRVIIYHEDFYKHNVQFYEINNILRPLCKTPNLLMTMWVDGNK